MICMPTALRNCLPSCPRETARQPAQADQRVVRVIACHLLQTPRLERIDHDTLVGNITTITMPSPGDNAPAVLSCVLSLFPEHPRAVGISKQPLNNPQWPGRTTPCAASLQTARTSRVRRCEHIVAQSCTSRGTTNNQRWNTPINRRPTKLPVHVRRSSRPRARYPRRWCLWALVSSHMPPATF
ncbi:hypothetical protein OH77DRAFT_1419117 [Trametes cingulata]|nr:hypothetical protein OH77DRAFT_1419117 [Trametes cingulata]